MADNTATELACVSPEAVSDGCVFDSNLCKGGVGTSAAASTPAGVGAPADNTVYPDTFVDWLAYNPYDDKYYKDAAMQNPTSQGVYTGAGAKLGADEAHVRGF